jgi:hypothetical protein
MNGISLANGDDPKGRKPGPPSLYTAPQNANRAKQWKQPTMSHCVVTTESALRKSAVLIGDPPAAKLEDFSLGSASALKTGFLMQITHRGVLRVVNVCES